MGFFRVTNAAVKPEATNDATLPQGPGGFFMAKPGVSSPVQSGHMPVQGVKKAPIGGATGYSLNNLKYR